MICYVTCEHCQWQEYGPLWVVLLVALIHAQSHAEVEVWA